MTISTVQKSLDEYELLTFLKEGKLGPANVHDDYDSDVAALANCLFRVIESYSIAHCHLDKEVKNFSTFIKAMEDNLLELDRMCLILKINLSDVIEGVDDHNETTFRNGPIGPSNVQKGDCSR